MDLVELKKTYGIYEKKYKLPGFNEMNDDFEIDKLDRASDNFIRMVRKLMMEKIVNSITFLEMLLNPVNAPRIYFNYLKNMSVEDKKEIERIYGVLSAISLDSLALEIGYSEKKEAELVKKSYDAWNGIKPGFMTIVEHMKNPGNNGFKKEKSYFG